jgi:hypothetical protein
MFYVYIHRRLSDGRVFYVGKGHGNRRKQKTSRSEYWKNVANKHGFKSYIVKKYEIEQDAYEHEKRLIEFYRSKGIKLVNIEDGGRGGSKGRDMSKAIAASLKARKGQPRPHCEETKIKISESHKGKKLSQDHIEKLRIAGIGRVFSLETRERLSKAYKQRVKKGYKQKAWNKGKSDIYTLEQRQQISDTVKKNAQDRLRAKGYYGGVGFHSYSGKWRAYLCENKLGKKKQISKGLYETREEAEDFLKINFPVV